MHPNSDVTSRMADKAQEAVDKVTEKAADLEQHARAGVRAAADRAQEVRRGAEREAQRARSAIEHFIREQPVTSAALAFAAGVITAALLRRR